MAERNHDPLRFDGGHAHKVPEHFDCETAFAYGQAAAAILRPQGADRIIVGTDTRLSADMLSSAVSSGIMSAGVNVLPAGVITAGEAAFLAAAENAPCILITASEEKYDYNGLKIFGTDGRVLQQDTVRRIETAACGELQAAVNAPGRFVQRKTEDSYVSAVRKIPALMGAVDLRGMFIAIDCNNGSAGQIISTLFSKYGARIFLLSTDPDGMNINTSDVSGLSSFVTEHRCTAGFMFNADASRVICIDEKGQQCSSDNIFAVLTVFLDKSGLLKDHTAVTTNLTNSAVFAHCEAEGIKIKRSGLGERNMANHVEKGVSNFASYGGMNGAFIFTGYDDLKLPCTFDGLTAAMLILSVLRCKGKKMSEIAAEMERFPQVELNIKITENMREVWKNIPEIEEAVDRYTAELAPHGRITVREGKDPVITVIAEGADFNNINRIAMELAEVIHRCVKQQAQ